MSIEFEKVIEGISRYINKEIYPSMNDWQEVLARIAIGRFLSNTDALKATLQNNGFVQTFGIINSDGTVNIDELLSDVKREISNKGKLELSIPLLGKITFQPCDVDRLSSYINSDTH